MAIIRWNPWNLDRMLDDDFEFPTIPGISKFMSQGLNLYETNDAIVAEAAIPGISEDKIDFISLTDMTSSFKEGSGLIGKWITNKNT